MGNLRLWSLPCSVRNAKRFRYFLELFKELEGREWNMSTMEQYLIQLITDKVFVPLASNLSDEQEEMISNCNGFIRHEDARQILDNLYLDYAWNARDYALPLIRYGLIQIDYGDKNRIHITPRGKAYLEEKLTLENMCMDAMLEWQHLQEIRIADYSVNDEYDVRPMIATMKILQDVNELDRQNGINPRGISKYEFIIFVMTLINHQEIEKQVGKIHTVHLIKKNFPHKRIFEDVLMDQYRDTMKRFKEIQRDTIHIYAKTIMEAFRNTGIFQVDNCCTYINLRPDKEVEIKELLNQNSAAAILLGNPSV